VPRHGHRVGGGRRTESVGQFRQPMGHQCWLFRRDPPDDVVLDPVTVGVLNGQRGLADPPIPYRACTTTVERPSANAACSAVSSPSRPVNTGLRAGTFHTGASSDRACDRSRNPANNT
jgi:hypothetical protein